MNAAERALALIQRVAGAGGLRPASLPAAFARAATELLDRGHSAEAANRQLQELSGLLEALL